MNSMRVRSAEMCMTIVVSLRIPPTWPPIEPFWPTRESLPRSRMLIGSPLEPSVGAAGGSGRVAPRRGTVSTLSMRSSAVWK